MYLEHFGLTAPPFKITPVTDFFFPGANRAEILDALIYAITESEGIIKVTGEVGSGKTMLCRMLLERLPAHMETVYLANPSLSREEMLYAIADGLGLNLEGQRVNIIMQTLQNLLAKKSAEGKRVVVLVDEAHAMPLDTLEELRLLYNLQLGDHKLLHIVLFGQPELNVKLSQPNMRQLKDRIVHHFGMLPLSKSIIIAYLIFRMRAAGYHGPNVFSTGAVKLIGSASNGLMRRVNILADKALLAAFIENTHNIEVHHVQAAIRDSELPQPRHWFLRPAMVGGSAFLILLLGGLAWFFSNAGFTQPSEIDNKKIASTSSAGSADVTAIEMAASAPIPSNAVLAATQPTPQAIQVSQVIQTSQASQASQAIQTSQVIQTSGASQTSGATPETVRPQTQAEPTAASEIEPSLLAQRLAATQKMLVQRNKNSASIQLFFTTEAQPERLENFLDRAYSLGKLDEIYILTTKINGKDGYRILYGDFPNTQAARLGMQQLPERYLTLFSPTPYQISMTQVSP